jgi:methylmalonyl-CoA decarboxylase
MITARVNGPIATICLDHPSRRNALSRALIDGLINALNGFRMVGVRAVILRAPAGSLVWSAGHDINELPTGGHDPLGWDDPLRYLVREIEAFPAPIIAMIEGTVWGGACELALACDLIVCSPEVTFAATPARHGVPYNASGLLTFLNGANLRLAKEMLFTAAPVPAERLERMGVINQVVATSELESVTTRLAEQIAANAPLSVQVMKEQLRVLASANAVPPNEFERLQGLRRTVYNSHDYNEGLTAFREKRKPIYRGD